MTPRLVIGIDFDNTLVSYDALFERLAVERGLVSTGEASGKKAIRDRIRRLPEGEIEWQKVQAAAYGPRIKEAMPSEGVCAFLADCHRARVPVYIVSHKTEFAARDETRTNLRTAALDWMATHGLSSHGVFFGATRQEKIQHIRRLGCTHFVDDLEEMFREPTFPADVEKILYAPWRDAAAGPAVTVMRSWAAIAEYLFPSTPAPGAADTISTIAARLLERDVASAEAVAGGRNGRVYRVTTTDGARYAFKAYFRQGSAERDRLAAEFDGLTFLSTHGVRDVPRPVAAARETGHALYEWVEGEALRAGAATADDIDAAVAFLGALRRLRNAPGSRELPRAAEACFSGQALAANLHMRLERLWSAGAVDAGLRAFLAGEFGPALESSIARSRAQLDFEDELLRTDQILSPSDFGFHNALRRDGRLVFLDFEHFGWDDPAKTVADFVLHPAMALGEALGRRFAAGMLAGCADDRELARRVEALYPLYGLKWCLILLNEFLPEHLSRRRHAGIDEADAMLRATQLEKARHMLRRILADEERLAHAR